MRVLLWQHFGRVYVRVAIIEGYLYQDVQRQCPEVGYALEGRSPRGSAAARKVKGMSGRAERSAQVAITNHQALFYDSISLFSFAPSESPFFFHRIVT